MLGNLRPYMPALTEDEADDYTAYYCGLCRQLGRSYGQLWRMGLSYDMALTAMLYDALSGEDVSDEEKRCLHDGMKKRKYTDSAGVKFASDVSTLLAWHKLEDDIRDEKPLKKFFLRLIKPFFRLKYNKAKKALPHLSQLLSRESDAQREAEKTSTDIDELCMPTARMTRGIFSRCIEENDDRKFIVNQFGFCLGRVIYLLDALLDRNDDIKDNKFNIFNILNADCQKAKEICFMALGEAAHWYSMLDLGRYKNLIGNIIYISIRRQIKNAA